MANSGCVRRAEFAHGWVQIAVGVGPPLACAGPRLENGAWAQVIELQPTAQAVIELTAQKVLNDARRAMGHRINVVALRALLDALAAALGTPTPRAREELLRQGPQGRADSDSRSRHTLQPLVSRSVKHGGAEATTLSFVYEAGGSFHDGCPWPMELAR